MAKVVSIKHRNIRINGSYIKFDQVIEPDIVTIIPVLDDGTIIMERQFRPAIGRYIYEMPAGHVNKGESPKHAAGRELEEETGYRARVLKPLMKTYHSPGSSSTQNNYFLARGLYKGRKHPDKHEVIEVKRMKGADVRKWLKRRGAKDTKTVIALLLLWNRGI